MTKQTEQTAGTMMETGNTSKNARIATLDERNKKTRVIYGGRNKSASMGSKMQNSGIGVAPVR